MYVYIILSYLIVINGIGICLMYVDKKRARQNKWRVQEKNLFIVAILGGSIGVFLGGKWYRHKTKHGSFTYGIPLIILFQIIVVGLCLYYFQNDLLS